LDCGINKKARKRDSELPISPAEGRYGALARSGAAGPFPHGIKGHHGKSSR